ncbi:hypothetical protein A9Q84_04910 [Halobacteriovorax marinus]|uniref:Uncharacterized protein n=1 Tax=Halobacteriovorax marinus TaxID=97084 RepID=A0A1Y5FHE5_9BACT|nr:hypothetical protein A9Q84_04910 [Halobacteriovorax marinus]
MEFIKSTFIIIVLLLGLETLAIDAEVIVLDAPLLSAPSYKAKVLQRVRKGKNLFIHRAYLPKNPWEINYEVDSNGLPLPKDESNNEFLKTLTTAGVDAWVPKKFVKIIYNDEREDELKMNPYGKYDPTDYRLEEPLPKNYPLVAKDNAKAYMSFGMGPASKAGFDYGTPLIEESIGNKYTFFTVYARKVEFDPYNRFYFGAMLQIHGQRSVYFISNDRTTQETDGEIGLGPYLSYDIYRTEDSSITGYGGFTYNLHRYTVEQSTRTGAFEERIFSGYSITPKLGAYYSFINFIPNSDLDFIIGAETNFNLAYTLKTDSPAQVSSFWNDRDQIDVPMGGQYSLFFGISAKY